MIVTLTIILAEISLALMVVLIVIGGKALRRRRRDRAAVNTLVTSIKTNRPARLEKLAGMLKGSSQLNDEEALGKANELIKKQNKFYQDAIDLYYTRNHEVLSKLDNRIEDLLSQYQGLITVSGGDAPTVDNEAIRQLSKDIAALSKELEELRAENATLSTQLKAAENELNQLGQEYVSAFNKLKVSKAKSEDDHEQAETTESSEVTVDSKPNPTNASESEQETEAEPVADKTVFQNADESMPNVEQANGKPANADAIFAADNDEDQGLLTDLDLAVLLGDQPGQPAATDKAADKS